MQVLVIGSPRGQLYHELLRAAPASVDLIRPGERLDITDRDAVLQAVEHGRPALIINAAAYTRVDQAESEPDLAYAVNLTGVEHLIEAARQYGARLVQVSTSSALESQRSVQFSRISFDIWCALRPPRRRSI